MIDVNKLEHIGAIVCVGSSAALFLTADIHPAYAQFGSLGGPRPVAITGIAGWIVAELRLAGLLVRAVEFAAAGMVLSFGVLLLTGYMASERMGFF